MTVPIVVAIVVMVTVVMMAIAVRAVDVAVAVVDAAAEGGGRKGQRADCDQMFHDILLKAS